MWTDTAALDLTIFPRYVFLQPRSFEGASGVRPKAERGAASRAPCLASTALGRSGTRPGGTTTLTRSVRYRDDSHAQRQCWKRAVSGSAAPETVNRRAERRWAQRPFAKGARTPAKACNFPGANRRSAPRLCEGKRTRRPPRRRPKVAADFAWLFDNVNRRRAYEALRHPRFPSPACGGGQASGGDSRASAGGGVAFGERSPLPDRARIPARSQACADCVNLSAPRAQRSSA